MKELKDWMDDQPNTTKETALSKLAMHLGVTTMTLRRYAKATGRGPHEKHAKRILAWIASHPEG
jgi:hypothetical protein